MTSQKPRAPLTPLDANAKPSLPSPKMLKDGTTSLIPTTGGVSPLKRSMPDTSSPSAKRARLSPSLPDTPTTSPDASSIFDTSALDGDSWATAATEDHVAHIVADAPALLAPRQRGGMTREEAREKARVLRLRLSLANYKVRTGQTTVPLAQLQHKPMPMSRRAPLPTRLDKGSSSRDGGAPERETA